MSIQRRIIHCFRAPVGGLFRHVCDLVRAQAERGHEIGIICDSGSSGSTAADSLADLTQYCALGVRRTSMSRRLGFRDLTARAAIRRFAAGARAEILHGHGAKGGAYARLVTPVLKRRGQDVIAAYTPHGGSLHYSPETLAGRVFLALERRLAPATDCLLFESEYASRLYEARIGPFPCPTFIVPNGLWPSEFYDIVLDVDAADFLFVGELRRLKGVDLLLEAMASLRGKRAVTALVVGSGPDKRQFRKMADALELNDCVSFLDAMPARRAFSRGCCLVVPSRAESFPYIVLEAAAAQLPMILTGVGGIPEIVTGTDIELVAPDSADALKTQMAQFLEKPAEFVERARTLQSIVAKRYRAESMADMVCQAYERSRVLKQAV